MVRVNHRYSVPMAGFVIVISVDVQDDRLEAKVKAWGLNEESFLIKKVVLRGSPARMETWNKLDELLDEEFYHAAGFTLRRASPRSTSKVTTPIRSTHGSCGSAHHSGTCSESRDAATPKRQRAWWRTRSTRTTN